MRRLISYLPIFLLAALAWLINPALAPFIFVTLIIVILTTAHLEP